MYVAKWESSIIDLRTWDNVGIFFIFSHPKDLEFCKVLNLKRKMYNKDYRKERAGLEPETICSRIFRLSTWATCDLTIAGGKKVY